jgi:hypothetical protein
MKMKNYGLFIVGFVTVSFVLLTGFEKPGVNNALLTEKQAELIKVKKDQPKNKENTVNPKHKNIKNKRLAYGSESAVTKGAEPQKSLDLSVPFNDPEKALLKNEQDKVTQRESSNMFASEKKKIRPLDLAGQMLMSQEPEVDKQKSLDGAGIVITLKR